jgi:hypothetical protein
VLTGLFFVVALRGYVAGLAQGSASALMAGLCAAVILALVIGLPAGVMYLVTIGLPVALLCYLALLFRPAEENGSPDAGDVEWYPPGRLVVWATLLAGGVAALSVPLLGFDAETYRETARQHFNEMISQQIPSDAAGDIDREQLESMIDVFVLALPPAAAMAWLGIMLTNMWGGAKLNEIFGHAIRPCPRLAPLTYPAQFPLGFMAALLLSFLPGILGIVATGFAGAFLFAYIVMGLVVLHVVARLSAFPNFLLAILYMAMLFLGWVTLLVAIVGLGEPIFKLRERALNGPPDGSGG